MSSNIRVQKTCEHCGKEFEARTLITRYCSHTCNRRHYKQLKREEKIERYDKKKKEVTLQLPDVDFDALGNKAFLSIKEAAVLVGVSERTFYRLMKDGTMKAYKLGGRTIIKRSDIDLLFT